MVGFGEHEGDTPAPEGGAQTLNQTQTQTLTPTETRTSTSTPTETPPPSGYEEVEQLSFLVATTPSLQEATPITDIRAFTSFLPLHPYHKVLS